MQRHNAQFNPIANWMRKHHSEGALVKTCWRSIGIYLWCCVFSIVVQGNQDGYKPSKEGVESLKPCSPLANLRNHLHFVASFRTGDSCLCEVIACFWFWIGDSGEGGWIDAHNLMDDNWEYQQLGLRRLVVCKPFRLRFLIRPSQSEIVFFF